MKTFRLWLLLLLAVLLPIRGALGAGMLCHVGGFGVQTEAGLAQQAHVHDSAGATGHAHQHDQHDQASVHDHGTVHDHAGGASHDHSDNSADKCNLCSAFCSVTGLVGAGVTVAKAQPVPTVFPQLYAPPASFFSDGQERPPRTL